MSVRLLTDTSQVASPLDNIRCYDIQVDGQFRDANGNSGTFVLGTLQLTATYDNDAYSRVLTDLSYTKFGYMVNLQLRNFIHDVVSPGGVFTVGTIPANIRPATTQRYVAELRVANSNISGIIEVGSNGIITLIPPGGGFPTGFGGMTATSITFTIN